MFFKKKKIIGLDIGSDTIKAIEVVEKKNQIEVTGFGTCPTPRGILDRGDIRDMKPLAKAIRSAIEQSQSRRSYVAMGLCGVSAIVKKINIPRINEKLIPEQLAWESEQYIPYDLNEVNIDYQVIRGGDQSQENIKLLLVAAIREIISKYVEVADMAGYTCAVMDVNGLALANAYQKSLTSRDSGDLVCLVNVGRSLTSMTVVAGKDVMYVRDLPVGGQIYTEAIQSGLGVSEEEAEEMKLNLSRGGDMPEALTEIHNAHQMIFEEIDAAVELAKENADGALATFLVTGGGALTPGFLDIFREKYAGEKLNLLANSQIIVDPKHREAVTDFGSVALGLSLQAGV